MNKKSILTLGAFQKDNQESNLSKGAEEKLAKLAEKPVQTTQKQNIATVQASTTQDKAKSDNKNKPTPAAELKPIQKAEAQKSNTPQAKKYLFNKEEHYAVMKYLQKHYPKCFPDKPPLLPLAIGIHNQLFVLEDLPFSKTNIRRFFTNYTRTKKYRNSLVVGADRIGLDGASTSKVMKEETKDITHKNANSKTNTNTGVT